MPEEKVGVITHYFGKIMVAGIQLTDGSLKVGDTIHIKGHTSDFNQAVESMQLDKVEVSGGNVGQLIGIKVKEQARVGDTIYRVTE